MEDSRLFNINLAGGSRSEFGIQVKLHNNLKTRLGQLSMTDLDLELYLGFPLELEQRGNVSGLKTQTTNVDSLDGVVRLDIRLCQLSLTPSL